MYDAIGTRENVKIIDKLQNAALNVQVIEYETLLGLNNLHSAQTLYFMSKQNVRARQVVFHVQNSSFKIQAGAMSYFQGQLDMVSGVTVGNAIGRAFTGAVTGESVAQPEYKGTGMLVSEPSFKHFYLIELEKGQEVVVDKGMFYAAQGSVAFKPIMQKNISSALFGGEGLFQISLTGPGIIVLESFVPICEVDMIELQNDVLKVDGNFAILRMGDVSFTVERSAKTLIGSAVSGEGLVNVFRGTGTVWLAPTLKIYSALAASPTGSLPNMNTSDSRSPAKK
ncbi:MAG: AIM24 family protein [Clostridiales bacterium]|nr:AIM24 family protein [Clostridiales bacterium]